LDKDILKIVQNALKASSQTLDDLARRCLNLGDNEDLSLASRIYEPVYFTLASKSIQKFEQQLQTNIMSVQIALYILDMGEKQELKRRFKDILSMMEMGINLNTSDHSLLTSGHKYVEATKPTIVQFEPTLVSSPPLQLEDKQQAPGSPIADLTIQELRAWGEAREQPICPTHTNTSKSTSTSTSTTSLIDSITNHSLDRFHQLLTNGANVNGTDAQGFTPLMHSVAQHDHSCPQCLECAHALLNHGADIDASVHGATALYLCIARSNLNGAEALLTRGASTDGPRPPLPLAVQRNQTEFVKLLVAHGADVNVVDDDDARWSLVHHAVRRNSYHALRALLDMNKAMTLGLQLDAKCAMDTTPLMLLAETAQRAENVPLAILLWEYGADVNAVDGCGYSALYYAVTAGAASPQRNKFVKLLLESGADVAQVRAKLPKRVFDRFPALRLWSNG
jgi:ankyrin repeat protein